MNTKELREKSIEELQALGGDIEKELYELKCKLSLEKKLEKPHLIREKRRSKARILTILQEKKV